VLHNVSLDVPAHSQVALVGESGSGKTVTMKAIMGLLREPPPGSPTGASSMTAPTC
jgi:peptide/nickel transport system ATP-binding protein